MDGAVRSGPAVPGLAHAKPQASATANHAAGPEHHPCTPYQRGMVRLALGKGAPSAPGMRSAYQDASTIARTLTFGDSTSAYDQRNGEVGAPGANAHRFACTASAGSAAAPWSISSTQARTSSAAARASSSTASASPMRA